MTPLLIVIITLQELIAVCQLVALAWFLRREYRLVNSFFGLVSVFTSRINVLLVMVVFCSAVATTTDPLSGFDWSRSLATLFRFINLSTFSLSGTSYLYFIYLRSAPILEGMSW
jgi:hypothetical protein